MSATTRRSFLLTDDGDLDTSKGTLQFATGLQAVKQAVRASILLFLGEWFLNTDEGTPWKQEILGKKNPNVAFVQSTLRARIARVPGVQTVDEVTIDYSPGNRSASVSFSATCDFGAFDDTVTQ